MQQLFISFDRKKEYILNERICEERTIGALLFAFLDFPWNEAERELLDYQEKVQSFPVEEGAILSRDRGGRRRIIFSLRLFIRRFVENWNNCVHY